MEIFKQLKELGYKHYIDLTIEELDKLPIDVIERRIECSLAIDWFREKYNLYISIEANFSKKRWYFVVGNLWEYNSGSFFDDFKTHYEAKEQAILKAIELCQKE